MEPLAALAPTAVTAGGRRIVLAMPGNEATAVGLVTRLGADRGRAEVKHFPDGESFVRLLTPVTDADVVIVCTLDRPDDKVLSLLWLAIAAREGGARRVGLVAPYLAYMRQDAVFQAGEIRAAQHFAALLSGHFDWVVTVDPHLHRIPTLSEIFRVPAVAVQAAPALAAWVRAQVPHPFLVGPDEESRQWVEQVAALCDVPWTVLSKIRRGAWSVDVSAVAAGQGAGRTPVLIDDIISTGRTLIAAAWQLQRAGLPRPYCVAVHAVFAGSAYNELRSAAQDVVTADSIAHPSNRIALAQPLADAIAPLFDLPLTDATTRLDR